MYIHLCVIAAVNMAYPSRDFACSAGFATQMWRGRCPATGRRALGSNILEICRWDRSEGGPGCIPSNLVLLAVDVADKVDAEGATVIDAAVRAKIEATLAAQRELGW